MNELAADSNPRRGGVPGTQGGDRGRVEEPSVINRRRPEHIESVL